MNNLIYYIYAKHGSDDFVKFIDAVCASSADEAKNKAVRIKPEFTVSELEVYEQPLTNRVIEYI